MVTAGIYRVKMKYILQTLFIYVLVPSLSHPFHSSWPVSTIIYLFFPLKDGRHTTLYACHRAILTVHWTCTPPCLSHVVCPTLTACLSDLLMFSQINLFFKSAHAIALRLALPTHFPLHLCNCRLFTLIIMLICCFLLFLIKTLFLIYVAIHIHFTLLTRQGDWLFICIFWKSANSGIVFSLPKAVIFPRGILAGNYSRFT